LPAEAEVERDSATNLSQRRSDQTAGSVGRALVRETVQVIAPALILALVVHLFLAQDLSPAEQNLDDDEVLSVEKVPLPRAIQMCLCGELRDAKSMCALLLAERRISAGSAPWRESPGDR